MRIFRNRRTRSLPLVLVVASVALAVVAPSAFAAKTEKVTTKTYNVTGATVAEIRENINTVRPIDYDAQTDWYVNWKYTSNVVRGVCRVRTVNVATKIAFTYPKWVAPAGASAEVATQWGTYMKNLNRHEVGHANIGRKVATRVESTITKATAPTCAALDKKLPALVKPHYTWGTKADVKYDADTDHGATQGATFG